MAVLFLFASLTAVQAKSADSIAPDADNILQSMSAYLGGIKEFRVNADIDFEVVDLNGQKLQLSSMATVVMERPAKFHIARKGLIADAEFIFDGETLTLYGKNLNVYARTKVPGTIYIAALPVGCTTVVIEGTTLHQCGATYYQPFNNQYVVVYVD